MVVFGNYPNWTYDRTKILPNDGMSYCHYTPFITAFILLIGQWVRDRLTKLAVGSNLFVFQVLNFLVPILLVCILPCFCKGLEEVDAV